jgi:hypothetical protein
MDFVATQSFKSPYVISTGKAHNPTQIKTLSFKKGDVIKGELKRAKDGSPAFVLHRGIVVIPLNCIKQVVTKDIDMSNAEGQPSVLPTNINNLAKEEKKRKYLDGIIIGGILGFAGFMYAEKQGWIQSTDTKNRIYAAIGGALAGMYFVYRFPKK